MKPYCDHLRKHELPSIEWLRQRFRYDPETGVVVGPRGRPLVATIKGYRCVYLRDPARHISVNRLAFALMTGRWPHLVDHIDGDKGNDRWANLREVTQMENVWNPANPRLGGVGLYRVPGTFTQGFGWQVRVRAGGVIRQTTRRDFCAAWKLRQRWFAERGA